MFKNLWTCSITQKVNCNWESQLTECEIPDLHQMKHFSFSKHKKV